MFICFTLFGSGIVVGGYRFFPGCKEEIASAAEFLNAEQVDSLSLAIAFFGGLAGLSLKYWMFASRKGILIIEKCHLTLTKESQDIISPMGDWKITIYKRNSPFRSKVLKKDIINRETDAKLEYGRKKDFRFHIILNSAIEYELFYRSIEKIENHVHVKDFKPTTY